MAKKLNMRQRFELLTRGLGWEPTYQSKEKVFSNESYEGIKIADWSKWEDPFRLTIDAYWKYQAEKDKKLYAVMDSFAQNNAHLNLADATYVNAVSYTHLDVYKRQVLLMASLSYPSSYPYHH